MRSLGSFISVAWLEISNKCTKESWVFYRVIIRIYIELGIQNVNRPKLGGRSITTTSFQMTRQLNPTWSSWQWPRCGRRSRNRVVISLLLNLSCGVDICHTVNVQCSSHWPGMQKLRTANTKTKNWKLNTMDVPICNAPSAYCGRLTMKDSWFLTWAVSYPQRQKLRIYVSLPCVMPLSNALNYQRWTRINSLFKILSELSSISAHKVICTWRCEWIEFIRSCLSQAGKLFSFVQVMMLLSLLEMMKAVRCRVRRRQLRSLAQM